MIDDSREVTAKTTSFNLAEDVEKMWIQMPDTRCRMPDADTRFQIPDSRWNRFSELFQSRILLHAAKLHAKRIED